MKIKMLAVSVIVMLYVCFGSAFAAAAYDGDEIPALLDEYRASVKCGSVSAAVYTSGELKVYGDEDGLYQIGSMTKAFTGLAVQKLIAGGAVSEQSDISEILPGFTAYYGGDKVVITVEHLLRQTSGYTNSETDYPSASAGMSLSDWVMSISGRELKTAPGAEYAYSNVNYDLLGAVIEQVTGRTYREYMEGEILRPLGLANTYVGMPEDSRDIIEGRRLGYRRSFEYHVPVVEGRIPAGYFYSNAEDMGRWLQIWLGRADIPDGYAELIAAVKGRFGNTGDYFSGWELFEGGVIGHSGGTPNYSSRIVFGDSDDIGVCVLTDINAAASTDSLCNGLYSLAAGGRPGEISTDVWTVFDWIFTVVSAAWVLLMICALRTRRRGLLIAFGSVSAVLLAALCIVLPGIFGAGLSEILFVWAPYSLAGGMALMLSGTAIICIRIIKIKYEDRKKTSKRSAADGHNRISRVERVC